MDGHLLDLSDSVLVHDPLGLDDHRLVVPPEGDEEVPVSRSGEIDEVPGIGRVDRHGFLDEHVGTRLERGTSVLVVQSGRAGDEGDVDAGVDDVAVVLAGHGEAVAVADLVQQIDVLARHADELHVVGPPGEVRQVRRHRPRTGADDAEAQLAHRPPLPRPPGAMLPGNDQGSSTVNSTTTPTSVASRTQNGSPPSPTSSPSATPS